MAAPDHRPLADGAVYDVVVVGARAAGAATALLLARHGLRTMVLDRGEPGTDTVSTHALMRGGVLQLSRWGVLPAIVAAGTPPIRRTTFRYGGEELGISIKPSPGVDALYAPRRTVLDPLLVHAAAAAGADVRYRTRVTEVLRSNGRVVGLRAGTPGQPPVDVRASLVVGADGMHSAIARLVGAPTVRQGVHTTAVTYGYWSDLPTDGYEWIFHPDACSGVIPTNGGQACVFASASPARIGRGGLDVVHQVVAEGDPELAARLRLATAPSGTRTWSGLRGYLRQASGPGWALVGDAGYLKDPISAHGLTDALRDAELLARAVAEAFDHTAMLDHALAGALADYQATRDRLSVGLFDVVDRIASQQWDTVEIGALLLQLSSAMAEEIELLGQLDEPAAA